MEPSAERPPSRGYETMGVIMGDTREYAVFHGFRRLYTENLLYQQAEIVHLEKELQEIRAADSKSFARSSYFQNWAELRAPTASDDEGKSQQLRKILQLRDALDKYYKSLLRFEKIVNMDQPRPRTMKNLWAWIVRPLLGNVDIKSCDDKIYANMDAKVMVSLDRTSDDPLTFWVQNQVIPVYHRFIGRRLLPPAKQTEDGLTMHYHTYSDETIRAVTKFMTVVTACALPAASIFILNSIRDTATRLSAIVLLSIAFSIAMVLMTPARTQEIFPATATFAAILVVFVGTDSSSP